jgi:hypothetical protein
MNNECKNVSGKRVKTPWEKMGFGEPKALKT